ncbi:MAG: beta-lactamase family protein, partial [Rubrivivax sp.]|nr:beta-lactamase family protein [Pyrinomonadaceae bacterium]
VSVGKGKPFETTDSSRPVKVKCADEPPACKDAVCFRSPDYYLNNAWNGLPRGEVWIAGTPAPVSTRDVWAVVRALKGGDSAIRQFNRQYVAAQLTLLAKKNADQTAMRSRLSCSGVNFAPLQLANGENLSPGSSLKDLFEATEWAARNGRAGDWRELAGVLDQLVGNDPNGGCLLGEESSFRKTVRNSLDRALTETMNEYNVPGAVVGVWVPGEGEWVTARGVSDLATGEPMRLDNHFRIGSNTKPFTVTALLELADGPRPKLKLDDPVSKYLSFVPNGNNITLRMLADMTSGLANYTEDDDFVKTLLSNPQRVWRPRELVNVGLALKVHFLPGEGLYYSNTNTVLLGMIIERVTGQSINEVFTRRIFNPLGLSNTIWPIDSAMPRPYSHGYTKQTLDGQQADATHWNPSWGYTAGQLISDLGDMKIWAKALGTGTLLSPEMQAERLASLKLPPLTTRSYGLGITQENGWLGHTGSLPGYTTSVYYLPSKRATIVVLTNSDISSDDVRPSAAIFKALAAIVAPENVPD